MVQHFLPTTSDRHFNYVELPRGTIPLTIVILIFSVVELAFAVYVIIPRGLYTDIVPILTSMLVGHGILSTINTSVILARNSRQKYSQPLTIMHHFTANIILALYAAAGVAWGGVEMLLNHLGYEGICSPGGWDYGIKDRIGAKIGILKGKCHVYRGSYAICCFLMIFYFGAVVLSNVALRRWKRQLQAMK